MIASLSPRNIAIIAMVVSALIWGSSIVVVRGALGSVEPLAFIWLRFLLVAVFSLPLGLYTLLNGVFSRRQLLRFALIETTNILAMWLAFKGLVATSTLYAAFFIELRPLFVAFGSIVFLKEREEVNEWLGLIIAAIGSFIIVLSPLMFDSPIQVNQLIPGILLLLASNIFNMIDLLLIKKEYHKLPKLPLLSTLALIDFVVCSVIVLGTNTPISWSQFAQVHVLLPGLFMALLVSIVATGLLFFSLDRIEASEAEIFNFLKPFAYIPLALLIFGEKPSPLQFLGLTVIFIGFIIANHRMTPASRASGRRLLKHSHHRL